MSKNLVSQKAKKEEEEGRVIGSALGGAILGAALFSGPGAIAIGAVGALLGAMRNEELKKKKNGH